MRQHNEKIYDTETAEQIAQSVLRHSCRETLYKTDNGEYFIHRKEGSPEQYVIAYDEMEPTRTSIRPQSETEALEWCDRNQVDTALITDDTNAKTMADGGTEEIRGSNEVRHSNDEVRRYSADGHLYAYRDGNDHIVVSRGNEPRTRWTKRVPAERDAVLAGEHLWTIPDNWQKCVNIKGAGASRYAIYSIPTTGVDVLVSVPNKTCLVDAWYGIKRVGTFNVTYDGEIAWDELEATIEAVRDIEEVSDDAVDALETLHRRRRRFERKYVEEVNRYAMDAVLLGRGTPTIEQWTTDPWVEVFNIDRLVQKFLDLDNETRDSVVDILHESDTLPYYPTVRVDIKEGEGVPEGYEIQALVEAGASGAETIDYLITEHYELMTQTDWAELRGKESSAISENVSSAKKKLSE